MAMAATLNCTLSPDSQTVTCNGTEFLRPEPAWTIHDKQFWIYVAVYCTLVLFAGLMSGLTLGLLSLDTTSLLVLKDAGTPRQRKHAARILPLIKRHHLLLVTLLLCNAAAVESMPLFLDRISDPITAVLVSISAVLFFGEIFPQALCSRYGLSIGAFLTPFVYVLMALVFIIAFPLAKLLDCLLGKNHATFYRRAELKALVEIHGPENTTGHGELTYDEVLIIKGALELKDKTAQHAMVPLESVFMLDINDKLDDETMSKILLEAHSRIPVYEGSRHDILGVLLVKTLIRLNPEDATTVQSLLDDPAKANKFYRPAQYISSHMPLYDLLNEFQKGKSHLSVVMKSPAVPSSEDTPNAAVAGSGAEILSDSSALGIITLEDILEELLQEEIVDETDVFVDVHRRVRVARAKYLTRSRPAPVEAEVSTGAAPSLSAGETTCDVTGDADDMSPLLDGASH